MSLQTTKPTQTSTLYPRGGYGAPKDRQGHAAKRDVGLPAGTEVFSADNHISVAEDIFYERFPDELKDKAPRIWYEDGAYMVGLAKGKTFLPRDFSRVLMQYDDLAGASTNNIEARVRELREDGIDKELAFPNAVLALFHYPDKELRERVSAFTTNTWPIFRSVPTATSTAPGSSTGGIRRVRDGHWRS